MTAKDLTAEAMTSPWRRWWPGGRGQADHQALARGLDAAHKGDLSHSSAAHAQGNGLLSRFSAMCTSLSNRIAQIRNNASIVAMAGNDLARGTHALSERTQQQAQNLSQAAAQVEQLNGRLQRNAQTAREANTVSTRMRGVAESGEALMQDAVAQVRKIELSSREMSEIIAVIDSIAFQTNILALNAAVEAARAGEQGRGFAVVASEVRSLAQRSAASAAQIKTLIAQSTELVETGVKRIEQVGQTLSEIVSGVRELATQVDEIAVNSVEQCRGLEQIATAVNAADALTQRNAEMVSESAHTARELEQRTVLLTSAVRSIRLRQGAADEARALVERACALVKRGGLETAVGRFTDKSGEFFDRDMYIFVFNRQGIFTAFGPNPSLRGGHLRQVQGLQWERLLRDGFACIDQGNGGWVEYQTVNPTTGAVNEKVSYVQALPGDLLIGCGVYKI
ncbi:MAG: cache domain-containing protein [Burkholderiaceae bacterium]|nr:cache domain-containing protein [Burkholderiaceae bacterium]